MNAKQIIEKHRQALVAIVAGLIVMLRQLETLPQPVRRQINRILRPAEAALRRLIVVVAAMLQQKAQEKQGANGGEKIALPDFSTFAIHGRLPAFSLIDSRKKFDVVKRINWRDMPRIWVLGGPDRTPLPETRQPAGAASLLRRIRKVQYALATLPKQAKRLNRLMINRSKAEPGPGRVDPIHPGHPPGHRRKPRELVDEILRECHWLAQKSGFKPP